MIFISACATNKILLKLQVIFCLLFHEILCVINIIDDIITANKFID